MSDDHSPDVKVISNVAKIDVAKLNLADLLDSSSSGSLEGGGFFMFDQQSDPGHTIVRIELENAADHRQIQIASFEGGADLNRLLGSITSDSNHS